MTNKTKSTSSKTSSRTSTKTATKTATKSRSKAKTDKAIQDKAILATCPVNGAGWCPYPFSISQLKKRLKAKALEAKEKKEAS